MVNTFVAVMVDFFFRMGNSHLNSVVQFVWSVLSEWSPFNGQFRLTTRTARICGKRDHWAYSWIFAKGQNRHVQNGRSTRLVKTRLEIGIHDRFRTYYYWGESTSFIGLRLLGIYPK